MRRKFVQIAALILAFSLLPTSFAAAETDGYQNVQQNALGNYAEAVSTSESSENEDKAGSEETEVVGSSVSETPDAGGEVTDPEQGATEPSGEGTAPEQDVTNPEGEGTQGTTDPEQETTEPGADPEQGTIEPGDEVTNPDQGTTEPEVPEIIVPALETEERPGNLLRVGLSYGDNALTSANLWNSVGTGYRFGFHDGAVLKLVGNTSETKISVLKTQNLYYTPVMSDGYSGYGTAETSGPAVGCIHLQLPGTYATFSETKAAADAIGGFPAWINGEFVVRYGTFLTGDAAREAQAAKGLSDAVVVGTSEYGLIVVVTGTNTPVFQYDGGVENAVLVVKPGLNNNEKTVTHYKGIKYYGSFCYERLNGGDITVVNLVDVDDYVRGVIPYEMSPSFPLEALKAQAVSARSYAVSSTNKSHQKLHFDVCTSIHCQVYYGTGGATARTDQAVDETAGLFAWYGDKIILAVFTSSDGGATENSENVWYEALPYLRGVQDPYEILALDTIKAYKQSYEWTKTYTGTKLQTLLNQKGFMCSEIVDVKAKNTDTGNVYSITLTDTNGKSWTFSKYDMKSMFGLGSMRFTVSNGGDGFALADNQSIQSLYGAWVVNGEGELIQTTASPVYAMTANGIQEVENTDISAREFVFKGTGSGHNLGMSQWGAYAMAKEGFTYDQILKFYFTGIEIHK